MASPQTDDGYTRIANEILEHIPRAKLNGTQRSIIDVIWRYTYGFRRKEHEFSLTFLAGATGINKRQIDRELQALIRRNIVEVVAEACGIKSRVLRFNKNYDAWNGRESTKTPTVDKPLGSTKTRTQGSTKKTTLRVGELDDQERKSFKENIKERETPSPKTKYADFVTMTQTEYEKLVQAHGEEKTGRMIEVLNNYKGSKGRKYKSDYHAILKWVVAEVEKEWGRRLSKFDKNKQAIQSLYEEGEREEDGFSEALRHDQHRLL